MYLAYVDIDTFPYLEKLIDNHSKTNIWIALELEEAVNDRFNLSSENTAKNAEIDMSGIAKDGWEDTDEKDEGIE